MSDAPVEKTFPVLGSKPSERVPWAFVAQFEQQAVRVHRQTIQQLSEFGGLCWTEIWGIMNGKDVFGPAGRGLQVAACRSSVRQRVQEWRDSHVSGTSHSDA